MKVYRAPLDMWTFEQVAVEWWEDELCTLVPAGTVFLLVGIAWYVKNRIYRMVLVDGRFSWIRNDLTFDFALPPEAM